MDELIREAVDGLTEDQAAIVLEILRKDMEEHGL